MTKTFDEIITDFCTTLEQNDMTKIISYALLSGGKRLRGLLTQSVGEDLGLEYDFSNKIALSIEIFHQLSLVVDDLPALDNDDMRHGKLTTHKQFDEASAILASLSMLTLSISQLLSCTKKPNNLKSVLDYTLKNIRATLYGEYLDVKTFGLNPTPSELEEINLKKTGKVFAVCLVLPALSLGKDESIYNLLEKAGFELGKAFQLQDDYLNITQDAKTLGKNPDSDHKNNKVTVADEVSLDKLQTLIKDHFAQVYDLLDQTGYGFNKTKEIIKKIERRTY